MALDHLHLVYGFLPNSKIEGKSNRLKLEEVRAKMVLYNPRVGVFILDGIVVHILLGNIHECNSRGNVSDLEPTKLKFRPVVGQFAQEFVRWILELLYVIGCDIFWMHLVFQR